jgi:fibronectin type 3 domain-containing protein
MKTLTNGSGSKLNKTSTSTTTPAAAPNYRTVKKLSRLSSVFEPLEARQMMSAVHHAAVVKAAKPVQPKPVKAAVVITAPTAMNISATSANTISLGWSDTGGNVAGYKLLRSINSGAYAQVAQVTGATTLTYTDNTASPHTSYSYKVEAYNGSTVTAAVTSATIKTPLAAPTGLAANTSGTTMVLKWTDNDSTATGYLVFRSTNGGSFAQLISLSGSTTKTYTDNTVSDGNVYSYQVQAIASGNNSLPSTIASAGTPIVAPSKLVATVNSSTWIHLAWTDNDPAATGYSVLRSTDGVHYTTISTLANGTANSFDDKTVSSLTNYYYEIQATTAKVTSAASGSANASTPLASPTWVMPAVIGTGSIQFSWADTDPNAKGYVILQAIGNGTFSPLTQLNSGTTTTWTDNGFTTNTQYSFEIEATNGSAASAPSAAVTVVTPLLAPTGLSANASSGTSVRLTWTDVDPNAKSYTILRSANGSAYQSIATVSGTTAASYTDSSASSGHSYAYEVVADAGSAQSAVSNAATVITPIAPPIGLNASASTGAVTSVILSWANQDPSTAGYNILRSTDNVNFTKIASLSGASTSTYTDNTATSAHVYYYEVQATNVYATSTVSNSAIVATPLLAPTGLTASSSGTNVSLAWTDKDPQATGYVVLRSTDGINYTHLAILNSSTAQSYTDTTVTTGQKYYYEVQATATGYTSPMSNTVNLTVPSTNPSPTPNSTVSITTRYSDELVVTATGSSDSIAVSQSGSMLSIVADGTTTTEPVPAAGLFVYTRGGNDSINIASTDTVATTVETIATSGVATITSAGSNVTVWEDSTDVFSGNGTVHNVHQFWGGVSFATGASLANPSDSGSVMTVTGSLWGTGPVAADVNQGEVGDCYFLSSLAAFAGVQPATLKQHAVDMGDGTYVVQYQLNNQPNYIRVSNQVPTAGYGQYLYARPGSDGDLWAVVMEKAFAAFRTGANTYNSINSGWMGEVYSDLGVANTAFEPSQMSASSFYTMVSNDLANGKEVTFGTSSSAPNLVSDHAYTLISASMVNGVATYVVRNPWGVQGDALENSQGYATLTFAQLEANFVDGCEAT